MHGLGNDYVYINCFEEKVESPSEVAKKVSHRHFGVGSDGLILICPSKVAHGRMEMYNADGSRGEMCGNGIRCVGKYLYDRKMVTSEEISIETDAGILTLHLRVSNGKATHARVNMGKPQLDPAKIPLNLKAHRNPEEVDVEGQKFSILCASMGNPHCALFWDDIENLPIEKIGPALEHHPLFPHRVNVEFIQVLSSEEIRVRVWERGSGETMACGTGACAAAVVSALKGRTGRKVKVHLLGGPLEIEWEENGPVYMTGPAEEVFTGTLS